MRDIGNVHPELEAAVRELGGINRVVKVTCIGGVNGHAAKGAQVAAGRLALQRLFDTSPDALRLRKRSRWELCGKPVGRDDRLDVEVKLIRGANAALDGHHGGAVTGGILRNAGNHHVALPHAKAGGRRVLGNHEEVAPQACVEWDHGTQGASELKAAEEGGLGTGDYTLHKGDLLAAAGRKDRDRDLVAIHGLAQASASNAEASLGCLDRSHTGPGHMQRARERRRAAHGRLPSATTMLAAATSAWTPSAHISSLIKRGGANKPHRPN